MKLLENRLPPPIAAAVTLAAMWGVSRIGAHPQPPSALRWGMAAVIGAAGLAFAAAGMAAFRGARTTINPVRIDRASRLVTGGIYRRTRNPMYVGLTAALISWALCLSSPWAWAGPAVFALFIHRFQILPEERAMSARFGPEYDDYRGRVRRWL